MTTEKSAAKEHKAVNGFKLIYILALSAIAIVSIVRLTLILKYLGSRDRDAHVVNYTAKLRTYSQSLAKTALLL